MKKYANLDLLRAVAVLLVAFGHLAAFEGFLTVKPFHLIYLGALGVMMFFVHTCLVLMQSLERDSRFVPFMIRRCFRIYPLALLMVGVVIVFRLPMGSLSIGHFAGFNPDSQDIFANLLLVQNFSGRTPILGPTWSLPYELQMYLLLPALFVFVRSLKQALGAWVLVTAASFLIVSHASTTTLANFAPCFMGGIVAYHARYRIQLKWWPAFLAVFVAGYLALHETVYSPWLATLALGLAIPAFTQITNKTLVAAAEFIAKYSYGIYLAHFVTLWLVFEKLHALPFAVKLVAFIGLTAAASWALFHVVEEPLIRVGKRAAEKYSEGRHEVQIPVNA